MRQKPEPYKAEVIREALWLLTRLQCISLDYDWGYEDHNDSICVRCVVRLPKDVIPLAARANKTPGDGILDEFLEDEHPSFYVRKCYDWAVNGGQYADKHSIHRSGDNLLWIQATDPQDGYVWPDVTFLRDSDAIFAFSPRDLELYDRGFAWELDPTLKRLMAEVFNNHDMGYAEFADTNNEYWRGIKKS